MRPKVRPYVTAIQRFISVRGFPSDARFSRGKESPNRYTPKAGSRARKTILKRRYGTARGTKLFLRRTNDCSILSRNFSFASNIKKY